MKRKILCLLLVLLMVPFAALFSACKNKGYNLNNLQRDLAAVETENKHIILQDGKYVFDYSKHENLQVLVQNKHPYTQIVNYNTLYINTMAFAFEYIDKCSNNLVVKNADVKNAVKKDLDEFKYALHNVDNYVTMLVECVNLASGDDVMGTACLTTLNQLLYSYETLFEKAIDFNMSLCDLYFNHILANGNPNIYAIGQQNFDVNTVINLFDARLKYQMLNLSACYYEMYIDGAHFYDLIINEGESLDLEELDYETNVDIINVDFDELAAFEKANNISNKSKFYELSVQAFNLQTALENDRSKFVTASSIIEYAGLDLDEASANEKISGKIIEQRLELVSQYNIVLDEMLKITGA